MKQMKFFPFKEAREFFLTAQRMVSNMHGRKLSGRKLHAIVCDSVRVVVNKHASSVFQVLFIGGKMENLHLRNNQKRAQI